MAIPIVFPNAEEAEDSYRSLDLLLEQLLITLRQVLTHRRREAAANAHLHTLRHRHVVATEGTAVPVEEQTSEQREETTRATPEIISNSLPLPDLVLDASQERGTAQEEKDTERTRTGEKPETTTTMTTSTATATTVVTTAETTSVETHSWVQVGADLRRLADQLLTTNRFDQKDDKKGKLKDEKEASLLSLFCPPLGGSVWTTVALLVGWGLLSRAR